MLGTRTIILGVLCITVVHVNSQRNRLYSKSNYIKAPAI